MGRERPITNLYLGDLWISGNTAPKNKLWLGYAPIQPCFPFFLSVDFDSRDDIIGGTVPRRYQSTRRKPGHWSGLFLLGGPSKEKAPAGGAGAFGDFRLGGTGSWRRGNIATRSEVRIQADGFQKWRAD